MQCISCKSARSLHFHNKGMFAGSRTAKTLGGNLLAAMDKLFESGCWSACAADRLGKAHGAGPLLLPAGSAAASPTIRSASPGGADVAQASRALVSAAHAANLPRAMASRIAAINS